MSQRFNTSSYVIEELGIGKRRNNLIEFFGSFVLCILSLFSDDNEIKIEKLEKQFSPKRKKDVKAIEGYVKYKK